MKTDTHDSWAAAELRRYSDSKGAGHTPGPWQEYNAIGARILKQWQVKDAGGFPVATVALQEHTEHEYANARLIAAAPELLGACKAAERVARVGFNAADPEIVSLDRGTLQHLTNTLRAAIAKAKGGGM